MNLGTFRDLLSPAGQQILQTASDLAPREDDFLQHFTRLERQHPPDLARLALEIAILRREAEQKFPFAESMYFTRQALEQASNYEISTYRARRFAGCERLLDLGCSVGGDSLALAQQAFTVGVDLDEVRLQMARANLEALGLAERSAFVLADLTNALPLALGAQVGVFFDPARRTADRRLFSVRQYQPPLAVIERWLPKTPAMGIKLSPGVDLDELRTYDAEVEFISLRGELKEAALWFGPLKTTHRRATVLPGAHTFTAPEEKPGLPVDEPRRYLYEPDPAILRAGLVQPLGLTLDAAQLDPDIAYLTAMQRHETPFARVWEVDAWLPFGVKPLRAALRQRGVEEALVKKRGSPMQPEELLRALHLREGDASSASRVLFLTHLRGRPIVILCYPNR